MPKNKKNRYVQHPPYAVNYKPVGIPMRFLSQVILGVDEYEAMRLVDYEGLDQEGAARKLRVSRATCARILETAHRKVAEALTEGKAILIDGGSYVFERNGYRCHSCGSFWEVSLTAAEDKETDVPRCPRCSSNDVLDLAGQLSPGRRRVERGSGWSGGRHRRHGQEKQDSRDERSIQ
jgi:predicted DNA-binding protein (UPF0251 family)